MSTVPASFYNDYKMYKFWINVLSIYKYLVLVDMFQLVKLC